MLLGIDVGGTFTDAVVIEGGVIVSKAKTPTTHEELLKGITLAIDKTLAGVNPQNIERVSLSTTIVTNTLVQGKEEKALLVLMPGPGMDISQLTPVKPLTLSGYTDHRGRQIAAPSRLEVEPACRKISQNKPKVAAVIGKFATRNPALEFLAAELVKEFVNPDHITLGSEVSGILNFLRRSNSAYYNAAVWRVFGNFAQHMAEALRTRGISAPVHILKADGGTMILKTAENMPVETIFTGPAASVLGIMALADLGEEQAVSLDIGGTTTDIALWQNKAALFAPGGARINSYPTAVRSFWLKSVGVGGDSFVRREDGKLKIGPMRKGAAMALGGEFPTVSDAALFLGLTHYGDKNLAAAAMAKVALNSQPLENAAGEVLDLAAGLIKQAICDMLQERTLTPVYKVEDVVNPVKFTPKQIIGVGGAASGLVPLVAQKLNIPWQIPPEAIMANAVGAAVAAPTTHITLRADTAEGCYTVPELLLKKEIDKRPFTLKDAWVCADRHLKDRAKIGGITEISQTEQIYEEEFNVIRGFNTIGKIITCKLQIKPTVLARVNG